MALWEGIALCRSENGGTETGSDLSEFLQWSQKLKLCGWESQLRARGPAVGTGQVAAPASWPRLPPPSQPALGGRLRALTPWTAGEALSCRAVFRGDPWVWVEHACPSGCLPVACTNVHMLARVPCAC